MSSFSNPLLLEWTENYGMPPFAQIQTHHFKPALEEGMRRHKAEIASIASNSDAPCFENTISSFDRSGKLLRSVREVFDNLCSSNCTPDLQSVELEMAVPLESHDNSIYTFEGLFSRIESVYQSRFDQNLNPEQIRLIERFHLDFVRNGANFSPEAKTGYAEIVGRLADLTTRFAQNVLLDESTFTLDLALDDLPGIPSSTVAAAKLAAEERSKAEDVYSITLSRSLVVPFLTYADRRDLRQRAWEAWSRRGEWDPARDNKALILDILRLRAEQAQMHGYSNFADYATADTMARTPEAVNELLQRVWEPACRRANDERESLQNFLSSTPAVGVGGGDGAPVHLEAWDWRYFAEKVRQKEYNMDENEIKPYFSLQKMCEAIFDVAFELFGLKFVLREDIPAYHPDVQVYEVFERSKEGTGEFDRFVCLFLHDNFARPHKKGGAWMSAYRSQSKNNDESGSHTYPIIVNNNNFNKGSAEEPTLLSFDDATTLFHEFGHGLHGMLSNVTYNRLAGTNVLRDFVELPSQLYEHWLSESTVLKKHARHYLTDEPIPDHLLEKMFRAKKFNEGFNTVEYTACALLDQSIHKLSAEQLEGLDVNSFEASALAAIEMPKGIIMRHRFPHFAHLFSSHYYAAGYYVYMWAQVLDADGFDAFVETGNCFDPEAARRVKDFIYSAGGSIDPAAAFRAFRGRDPSVIPMLKKNGLLL